LGDRDIVQSHLLWLLANTCRIPSLWDEHVVHSSINSSIPSPSPLPSHLTPFPLCNTTQFHRQWYNIIPTYLLVLGSGFMERKARATWILKGECTKVYTFQGPTNTFINFLHFDGLHMRQGDNKLLLLVYKSYDVITTGMIFPSATNLFFYVKEIEIHSSFT
jgi:hypothetical protein